MQTALYRLGRYCNLQYRGVRDKNTAIFSTSYMVMVIPTIKSRVLRHWVIRGSGDKQFAAGASVNSLWEKKASELF